MGTVSWTRGGSPLALFAEGFCQELTRRGHPATTVKHHITLMGQLSCWLGAQGLSPSELNKARAEEFLAAHGPSANGGCRRLRAWRCCSITWRPCKSSRLNSRAPRRPAMTWSAAIANTWWKTGA